MMRQPAIGAALLTSSGTAAFGLLQNRRPGIGGRIHWSKVLWLNLAINTFVVLPGIWWRRSNASPAAKRMLGLSFGGFAARSVVEMYLVYVTRSWKMRYGISHDLAAVALLGTLLVRDSDSFERGRDDRAVEFGRFTVAALLVEIYFAVGFRRLHDPSTDGVFFADDSPQYARLITVTKWVVAIGYPILAINLWRSRRDFARSPARRSIDPPRIDCARRG